MGVDMSANVNITYDLLFDILRYEKSREELQNLDENFFKNVSEYLNAKQELLIKANTPTAERELTRIQLNNIKKILIELYERRERKIINLALYKIKTGADMGSSLLKEEKLLFDAVFLVISKYRTQILDNLLDNKIPNAEPFITETKGEKIVASKELSEKPIRSVRFVRSVPKFIGPELETYGPFEEDDIASLPSKIVDVLIRKQRAEEIQINTT